MSAAHLQIARGEREFDGRTGPKAAFDFYMGQSTPTAAATRQRIGKAGNSKKQFAAYCALPAVKEVLDKVSANGAVRSEDQRLNVRQTIAERLGRTRNTGVQVVADETPEFDSTLLTLAEKLDIPVEILASLANDGEQVETPTPASPKVERTIPAATRISFRMAMALKKIATKTGESFVITGKTGGEGTGEPANYGIKLAGLDLTPAEASALIASHKKA
jgi:hypothetical protein